MMPFSLVPRSLSSINIVLCLLVAAFVLAAPPVAAQSVSVTVNDTAAVAGDTVAVPVSVGNLDQSADVNAYGFELAFADDSLSYAGVDTTNTLSGQAGFTVDDNPDVPRIGAFGPAPINDEGAEGVLIRLRLVVAEPGTTQVALDALQFNGGSPPADPGRPTFSVTGTPPNGPPVAAADRYETTEDQPLQVDAAAEGVLANDSDPNGDSLTANLGPSVTNGSLTFNGDGTFVYTPDSGFTGDDTFRYAATDPNGAAESATVTIGVVPPNTAPTITSIADQTISEDSTTGPLSVTIDDNETDPSSLSVRVTSDNSPLVPDDSISLGGTGTDRTITVAPVSNAFGTAIITATVSDGVDSTQTQFAVTVQSVNDPPVAAGDEYQTVENDTLRVADAARGLLANDTDVDDDPLSATVVDSTSNGALSLDSTGTFSYAPDAAFTGEDAFTYELTDGRGGRDTATAALTVLPSDSVSVEVDSVVATTGDTAHVPLVVRNLDRAADVTAYSFDLQFDDDTLTYAGVSTDSTLSGEAGFTVENNAEATRIGAFGGTSLDSVAAEGTLLRIHFVVAAAGTTTVALNNLQFNDGVPPAHPLQPQFAVTGKTEVPPNRAPRAYSDRYTVTENRSLTVRTTANGVLGNDADPDGDALTASLSSSPSNGTLALQSDGTFKYTPDTDFTGTDSLLYRVSDPNGLQDSTTATISVTPDSSIAVRPDDVTVALEDTVSIPVRLDRLDETADITSYGFELGYDTSRVSYAGFETDRTLSKQAGFTVDDNPDIPRIGAFGSRPLNDQADQGVMLRLNVVPKASGATEITLRDVQFNNGTPAAQPDSPSFFLTAPSASDTTTVTADNRLSFDGTGLDIHLSGISGSGTVVVQKYGVAPSTTEGITEDNVSEYHFQIQADTSLSFTTATLFYDVSMLAGVDNAENVTTYTRASEDQSFTRLTTSYNASSNELSASNGQLGTFVLASNTEPLPVELAHFDARRSANEVRLTWQTESETNNAGFRVQRRRSAPQSESEGASTNQWDTLGSMIEGAGTSSKPHSYRFSDSSLPYDADQLVYRLKQIDTDGSTHYSRTITVRRRTKDVQMTDTTPNPARQQATLRYAVPDRQHVTIRLYDVLGREVKTLVNGKQQGRRKQKFDVSSLPSGVYFLRLRANGVTKTQRFTVLR